MALFCIQNVAIKGIATCVPKKEVSNFDCELLTEKERKLFVKTTGIEKRRIAEKGVCASDLCKKSAALLIEKLGWQKSEIQVLIFVTQTPDYVTPSTAIILQHELQLPNTCLAFDINLGCSGYVYGLSVVASLLQNMQGAKGLLLVGDVSSACISPLDKSVVPLFSDAGSATALQQVASNHTMLFNLENDGNGYKAIMIKEGGYRFPFNENTLQYVEVEPGIQRNANQLVLNGIDIFNFSVTSVPFNIKKLLQHFQIDEHAIDYFVLHQANKIINDTIADAFDGQQDKFLSSLQEFGNTSSASIPITLTQLSTEQITGKKLHLLLSGFGVGLSWGSVYTEVEDLICINDVY